MIFLQKNPSSLSRNLYGGVGKRLFLGLMCGSCIFICICIGLAWLIPFLGLSAIHTSLPYIFGGISALLILCVSWMCIALAYHVYTGKHTWGITKLRGLTIKLMFPLMELLGRLVGIPHEKIRLSFVKVNNEIVLGSHPTTEGKNILVLLPHCIQRSQCTYRLNHSIEHCRRCGLCPVGELLALRDVWGFHMVIATGGTIARRIVVQMRPHLIIAVACDRDLTSGIQDSYPLPVFGITNERPCGPCIDTLVNVTLVEDALRCFVKTSSK